MLVHVRPQRRSAHANFPTNSALRVRLVLRQMNMVFPMCAHLDFRNQAIAECAEFRWFWFARVRSHMRIEAEFRMENFRTKFTDEFSAEMNEIHVLAQN